VSPYMVDEVQPLCRVPVSVVPNPIALRSRRHDLATRPAAGKVLMVCNGWGPRKNGNAGLLAYALLRQRLPGVELLLIGSGTEQGGPAWQDWRRQGSPGRVVFNGAMAHGAVLDAMAASDLMLHPALEESFGAVLAEAMSVGLPVVAGLHSGAVPWVVADAGALVDVTRPQAMADAMLALLIDPAALTVLSKRGREQVAARFSAAAVVAKYEREYEFALNRAPSTQKVPA